MTIIVFDCIIAYILLIHTSMGIIYGLLSMFSWGTGIFFEAKATRKIGNIKTLFWMQLIGFILAITYLPFAKLEFSVGLITKHLPVITLISILQIFAYMNFYKGLEKADVSLVSPIASSWGMIVSVLGIIFFNERPEVFQLVGIVIIVLGIVFLSVDLKTLLNKKKTELLVGVKEGVFAMFGWGFSLFLLGIPSKDLGWYLPVLIFRGFIVFIMFVIFYKTLNIFEHKSEENKLPYLLLFLIGFFDVIGFFAYSLGVSNAFSSIVAPIASSFVLVSIVLSLIFFKEKINLTKIIGISTVVIGLILVSL